MTRSWWQVNRSVLTAVKTVTWQLLTVNNLTVNSSKNIFDVLCNVPFSRKLILIDWLIDWLIERINPSRGRVIRVTDCGVEGLWFKSPGSILTETSSQIQELCNHWCMILNPNKTKALVVSRSITVNHHMVTSSCGDLVYPRKP